MAAVTGMSVLEKTASLSETLALKEMGLYPADGWRLWQNSQHETTDEWFASAYRDQAVVQVYTLVDLDQAERTGSVSEYNRCRATDRTTPMRGWNWGKDISNPILAFRFTEGRDTVPVKQPKGYLTGQYIPVSQETGVVTPKAAPEKPDTLPVLKKLRAELDAREAKLEADYQAKNKELLDGVRAKLTGQLAYKPPSEKELLVEVDQYVLSMLANETVPDVRCALQLVAAKIKQTQDGKSALGW